MNGLRADVVHAVRHYLTTPLSSVIAVLVLAAAIAVLTAFLALWSDLVLTSHPGFERSREFVTVANTDGRRMVGISYGLIERARDEVSTIRSIAGVGTFTQFLERDNEREPISTELVTADFFPGLGPRTHLGRAFDAADHRADAEAVVIVSDAFWQEHFGGRADVLGQTLRVHGPGITLMMNNARSSAAEQVRDYRIVGVMSRDMEGTFAPDTGLWMPFESTVEHLIPEIGGLDAARRGALSAFAIARVARGTSAAAVRTELQGRYADAPEFGIAAIAGMRIDAIEGVTRTIAERRDAITQLNLFLGGSALLALVAACNVSLFLLSRAPGRRRELAIRMAVGAPLKRLARQLVTEGGVLVAVATALGIVFALWVTAMIRELAFLRHVQLEGASPFDWRVLAIVAGAALVVTALVSLAPVWGLKRIGIAAGSRAVTARAGWTQRLAGSAQLAVAAVISAAAIAFYWYLVEIGRMDAGFSADNVLVVMMAPENPPAPGTAPGIDVALQERERRRALIAQLPGVEDVAFGTSVPGQSRAMILSFVAPPDRPDDTFPVTFQSADPAWLRMLNARLLDGRLLEDDDRDTILINETLARLTWDRVDVAGELLPGFGGAGNPPRQEVIGVIRDIAYDHPTQESAAIIYQVVNPLSMMDWTLVRTNRSIADLQREIQRLIDDRELLEVRLDAIRPLDDIWREVLAPDRARTGFTSAIALLVVALAGFGYFGTQRFLVAAGRREYAILAALGAGPRALVRLVLSRGLLLGAPGLVLGTLLAFITVAWMRGDFISQSVSPFAIAVLVAVAISALLIVASLGPAREVCRTPPAPLLRQE
jgi:putative ABC transport system permease protein